MFQILAINPGSTSTKIGLFEDDTVIFKATLEHPASELEQFRDFSEQKPYRREKILEVLQNARIDLNTIDAFVGRGGGQETMVSGTYHINKLAYEHARIGYRARHPALLGCQIAYDLGEQYTKQAFMVNPPCVDEFIDEARISGMKGIRRISHTHALNQKEVGIRFAKQQGKEYQQLNLIIAHIGGGISVTAHRKGKMIDSNDCLGSSGPFAPTRCGDLPTVALMKLCYSGQYSESEMYEMLTKSGGLVSYLGTSDVREVRRKIAQGDEYAAMIMRAMVYQIEKEIGSMAAALKGQVDTILLTGGVSNDEELVRTIEQDMGFVAPVLAMPGEFELEAMANGVLRVLQGEESAREYTGVPVFRTDWFGD